MELPPNNVLTGHLSVVSPAQMSRVPQQETQTHVRQEGRGCPSHCSSANYLVSFHSLEIGY